MHYFGTFFFFDFFIYFAYSNGVLNWTIDLIEPIYFVRVSAQGDFAVEDCFKMKEDFLLQDYWKPGMNILIDYRKTVFSNINLDILRKIGGFHESKNKQIGNGRMAFLMKSPRDFGFARQYEMITEGRVLSNVRVFLDEDECLQWLTSDRMSAQ